MCALSDAIRERASLQSEETPMGPTGSEANVVQIHPTRRCNLRCQHCYSSSGPQETAELSIDSLERFLVDVAQEGFNGVSNLAQSA